MKYVKTRQQPTERGYYFADVAGANGFVMREEPSLLLRQADGRWKAFAGPVVRFGSIVNWYLPRVVIPDPRLCELDNTWRIDTSDNAASVHGSAYAENMDRARFDFNEAETKDCPQCGFSSYAIDIENFGRCFVCESASPTRGAKHV